jgi:hypothetical protein
VSTGSDLAELSTLRTQVDELTDRVLALAGHYDGTPDAAVAADLFGVERALVTARRALDRATDSLGKLDRA